jgi:hypothetical protein
LENLDDDDDDADINRAWECIGKNTRISATECVDYYNLKTA